MTPELFWLTLTAILATSLWIPYIVLSGQEGNAQHQSFARMPRVWDMSDAAQRAYRAHQNLLEQFLPFAVLVIVAHVVGVSNGVTVAATIAFFWLRVLHAVGHISGRATMPLRPLIFTGGWLCTLAVAAALLWSAL